MSRQKTTQWQPMSTAPKDATEVLVLTQDGKEVVAHWASNLSGEEQPPFHGWFMRNSNLNCYVGISEPQGWRPIKTP